MFLNEALKRRFEIRMKNIFWNSWRRFTNGGIHWNVKQRFFLFFLSVLSTFWVFKNENIIHQQINTLQPTLIHVQKWPKIESKSAQFKRNEDKINGWLICFDLNEWIFDLDTNKYGTINFVHIFGHKHRIWYYTFTKGIIMKFVFHYRIGCIKNEYFTMLNVLSIETNLKLESNRGWSL